MDGKRTKINTVASSLSALAATVLCAAFLASCVSSDSTGMPVSPPLSTPAAQEDIPEQPELVRLYTNLTADKWEDRELAQQALVEKISATKNSSTAQAVVEMLIVEKDPEISLRAGKALKEYFLKQIHDPERKKGFLGLKLMEHGEMVVNNERCTPIRVVQPQEGFPGHEAGIRAGDLIMGIDGRICSPLFSLNDFIVYVAAKAPGTEVVLAILRRGKTFPLRVVLGVRPDDIQGQMPAISEDKLFSEWIESMKESIKLNNKGF